MFTNTSFTIGTKHSYEVYQPEEASPKEETSTDSSAKEPTEIALDKDAFYNLTLYSLQTGTQNPALLAETLQRIDAAYPHKVEDLPAAVLFIETAMTEPTKASDFCVRSLIGKIGVEVESLKYAELEKLISKKEEATAQIKKIHDFLTVANKYTNLKNGQCDMKERKELVDEMRSLFGEDLFPPDVYAWNSKEQVEALRASLFNWIQDKTTEITMHDLHIGNYFEEMKQMLDILRQIGKMEEESTNKIINHSSR